MIFFLYLTGTRPDRHLSDCAVLWLELSSLRLQFEEKSARATSYGVDTHRLRYSINMQTQQNKENPLFLNSMVKNEGNPSDCSVKQENVLIDDTCQLTSPTFNSSVKRPLIDSQHDMATSSSKRVKQEWDEPSFWANKERRLLSSKKNLENIVREMADSFESNNCVRNTSFEGLECSNRNLSGEDNTKALKRKGRQFESSTQIVASANEVTTGDEAAEVVTPTINCRKEERSVPSVADPVQPETAKPILRPLKSLDSGLSDGYAFDHNFFPKLIGVHSALSPTSSLPELESHRESQQTAYVPLLKKLVQNQEARDRNSSPLQNAENTLAAVSNRNFHGHCKDDQGHTLPKNTGQSLVTPSLSRIQNATTCDTNLCKRDLLEDSRVHVQNASRTLLSTPLAPPAGNRLDLSPRGVNLSVPWMNASLFSQKEHETKSPQTATNICTSTEAAVAEHAQGQDSTKHDAVNTTSRLSPLLSPVSPRSHSSTYSNKQTFKKSSKKLKSVNKHEMVNIYRMATSASLGKNQIKGATVHSPSDSSSQKPCDLLFSFTKADGKNDLFLVVDDEVFAVKRFDYKGVSYLIHTDKKGKASILAKLPEEEKLKLQHNDKSSSSGQHFPSNRASAGNITSSSSKQSSLTSRPKGTPQCSSGTSLSITALQTFCEETCGGKAQAISGQQPIQGGISRITGGQGRQIQTAPLEGNEVLSQCQAMYGMRTQSDTDRPVSFSRSGNLNLDRRQLLKKLLNGIRAGASRRKEPTLDTHWPQSVPVSHQHSSSHVCAERQDRPQGRAVPINASSNPRSTHAAWNRCDNQQFNVNPNLVDRNQATDETHANSYEQCTFTSAQSTCNGNQAVRTRHQPYDNEETVDEDNYRNFATSNKPIMSGNRNPERMKLMNYIARRLASKSGRASSTANASDYNQPPCSRSEVERQSSNKTMANPSSTRATNASTRRHEELPPLQQRQRLMDLLAGTYNVKSDANRNNGGLKSSSRKRQAEATHVANSPIPARAQGMMDRWINFENELWRTRVAEQRHSLYVDTTPDSPIDDECRSGNANHQPLNDRRVTPRLLSNQSNTTLSPVSSDGDEIAGLIQEHKCPSNDTFTQNGPHFTDCTSTSSSNYHNCMSHTSLYGRSYLVCCGQHLSTAKRLPGHETNVNECLANIAFNQAVEKSGSAAQRESVSALISGQQRSTNDAPVRGTAEVSESLDEEETDTDDGDDVEIISPPPKRYSSPNTLLDADDKGIYKRLMEQENSKISHSALRAELVTKIQATRKRRAQENVEWKRKYLYRVQMMLENKLAKVCGVAHVIVIDDE